MPRLLPTAFALAAAAFAAAPADASPPGPAGRAAIVGGQTSARPWPSMAALITPGEGRFQGFFCGATVISRQAVLTAAHCVVDDTSAVVSAPDEVMVLTGSRRLSRGGKLTGAARVIPYPGYDPGTAVNDAAVIILSEPPGVPAAQIEPPGRGSWHGQPGLVAGWGDVTPGDGSYPDELHDVTVPVLGDARCQALERDYRPAGHLCAAAPGKDSCSGDSGGPLMAAGPAGGLLVAGIVSWGPENCGEPGSAGVYTRVSAYSAWIARQAARGPEDRSPPSAAWAGPARLAAGQAARISFTASDDSGAVSVAVRASAGAEVVLARRTGTVLASPGRVRSVKWKVPASLAGRAVRVCLAPQDQAGNDGPEACRESKVR